MKLDQPGSLELRYFQETVVMRQQPAWWHRWGGTLRLAKADGQVVLVGPHASLRIDREGKLFPLTYEIRGTDIGTPYVERTIMVEPEVLKTMFNLEHREAPAETFNGGYTAEEFVLDRYIRHGPFLNIPGPGDGQDGNPNISVYIFEGMRRAVAALIGAAS